MTLPNRGSVEWFQLQKEFTLVDVRALDSISAAYRSADKLRADFDSIDREVNSSLLTNICVSYARPFSQKPHYPHRFLREQPQFDVGVHKHLLELRDKLIAHSDSDYAESTMHHAIIMLNHTKDDVVTTMPIPHSLHVRVTALDSIHSVELLDRFVLHIRAAVAGISIKLDLRLREFLLAANEFVDNLREASRQARLKTGSQVKSSEPLNFDGENPILVRLDQFKDPLKVPPLQMGKDGYVYRTIELTYGVSGDVVGELGGEEFKLSISSDQKVADSSD
jgi:hypothetical protein